MRRHRDLRIHAPKEKDPVPGYRKKIKEAQTKFQLRLIRNSIVNNLNVSNLDLEELSTEIAKKILEV